MNDPLKLYCRKLIQSGITFIVFGFIVFYSNGLSITKNNYTPALMAAVGIANLLGGIWLQKRFKERVDLAPEQSQEVFNGMPSAVSIVIIIAVFLVFLAFDEINSLPRLNVYWVPVICAAYLLTFLIKMRKVVKYLTN